MGGQRAALLLLAAAPLAGCAGFQPLYAMPNVAPALRTVDVTVPRGRMGYLLRQEINDELARDFAAPPRYRLELATSENRIQRGLRQNNVAAEIEMDLRVTYRLVESATSKELLRGVAPVTVFYATSAPYAGIAAQQDAEERAADQIAVQIRLALSSQFARAASPAPARP